MPEAIPLAGLEPALAAGDVSGDEFRVALGQVNDAFDQPNDSEQSTSHQTDDELNDTFLGVTEDEFVGSGPSEKDAKETGE